MLYPTTEAETAVDVSLAALREAVREDSPATAIAGSATALLARWRRLERSSPYRREALSETLDLLTSYCADDVVRTRQLLPEREKLVSTLARQEIADSLRQGRSVRGLSVRQAAQSAALAPSYLSELEGARRGLPSAEVAGRLDTALGTSIGELAREARERIGRFRAERRKASVDHAPQMEADPRLVDAMATLRQDPSLLDLLDYARQLDTTERRAVVALVRELRA
jgi:transcriptional regulator with XRE-family HTH domain